MKAALTAIVYYCFSALASGGESGLVKTFQPIDGLGSGKVIVAEVTCLDWYSHSGQPTTIGLISAKNVPPTNSEKAAEDINLASLSNLVFRCDDIEAKTPKLTLTADKFVAARDYSKEDILRASLECLRRVLPQKLTKTDLTFTSSEEDHDLIAKIVLEFNKADRGKVFYPTQE